MAQAQHRGSLEMEEESWALPPALQPGCLSSLACSSITPTLGSRHRRDPGAGSESTHVSHPGPKGIIDTRFNEIREFSPRCLKDSES